MTVTPTTDNSQPTTENALKQPHLLLTSLRDFPVEDLCALAQEKKASHVALTDINNTSACLHFLKIAAEADFKPIVGVDFRNGAEQQYVCLAKNNCGFKQMNEHLTAHLHVQKAFEKDAPELPDCFMIYPLKKVISETNHFSGRMNSSGSL